jgi:hypothetical protein
MKSKTMNGIYFVVMGAGDYRCYGYRIFKNQETKQWILQSGSDNVSVKRLSDAVEIISSKRVVQVGA